MTTPTRVQFTKGATHYADALRYPARELVGAPTVVLMLVGFHAARREVLRLAMHVAGAIGLSLEVTAGGDLFVVGISTAQAEHGADRLVAEMQRALAPGLALAV
jgi:hypothetical protein